MLYNLTTKPLETITKYILFGALFLFPILSFSLGKSFEKDSITISENAKKLISSRQNFASEDSVIDYLTKNVTSTSHKTKDLVQYHLARYYYVHQKIDQALNIVNKNTHDAIKSNDAKFYNIKGAVYSLKKKYNQAIRSFIKASNAFNQEGQTEKEYIVYNNIANIYIALGDYKQAYKYSALCFSEYRNRPKKANYFSVLGILAICETNLNMFDSAQAHIDIGFRQLKKESAILPRILLHYAKAELAFKLENFDQAVEHAKISFDLSEKNFLKQYEVISAIILMKASLKTQKYTIALHYAQKAKNGSAIIRNLSVKHSIAKGLSEIYSKMGDYKKAFHFMKITDSLKTIDRNQKNKTNLDKLLVEFESLKHKNKILKQDITITKMNHSIEVQSKIIITTIFSILFLCFIIIGIFIYNKQRLRFVLQKQKILISEAMKSSEEKERARLSSELHDGLASELTALRFELEQSNETSKKAYKTLERAHHMTRSISHNLSPFLLKNKGLVNAIAYVVENNYSGKNIRFYTNILGKLNLSDDKKVVLFRSTQELIQNAIKHSKASEISVQILKKDCLLSINIEDDGVGMAPEKYQNAMSLNALKNRIEIINGELHIETAPNNGTMAFIKINLDNE